MITVVTDSRYWTLSFATSEMLSVVLQSTY